MITVHGRTRSQFYDGKADWRRIAPVVEATSLPVIANGDIVDPDSARSALDQSGAAGVMVGRGAIGRPWLPGQIAASIQNAAWSEPSPAQKLASMTDQIAASVALYGERLGVRVVRKHVAAFVDAWADDFGLAPMNNLRVCLCQCDSSAALIDQLQIALSGRRAAA